MEKSWIPVKHTLPLLFQNENHNRIFRRQRKSIPSFYNIGKSIARFIEFLYSPIVNLTVPYFMRSSIGFDPNFKLHRFLYSCQPFVGSSEFHGDISRYNFWPVRSCISITIVAWIYITILLLFSRKQNTVDRQLRPMVIRTLWRTHSVIFPGVTMQQHRLIAYNMALRDRRSDIRPPSSSLSPRP